MIKSIIQMIERSRTYSIHSGKLGKLIQTLESEGLFIDNSDSNNWDIRDWEKMIGKMNTTEVTAYRKYNPTFDLSKFLERYKI